MTITPQWVYIARVADVLNLADAKFLFGGDFHVEITPFPDRF